MRWSIITLLALSLACTKKQDAAPAEPEQAADTEAPEATAVMADPAIATDFKLEDLPPLPPELGGETPKLGARPSVIVIEQGDEPRQELRWAPKPGFEQKVTADLGLSVDAVIVLVRSKMPKTVISYDLTMQAKKVRRDGTVRVAFKVDDARPSSPGGAKPARTEAQQRAMRQRADVVGSYKLSPRGAITDFELTNASDGAPANPGLVDALRWSLAQMTPVLPEEPVGAGAKWTVHESILQGGIHANQLRTIELVKLDGNRVELSVEVRQTAAPQPYTNPLTGATFELETLNGIASGSLVWDLGQLAPLATDLEANALDGAVFRNEDRTRKVGIAVHNERTVKIGGK